MILIENEKTKTILRLKEMIDMGYPIEFCRNLIFIPGQDFAFKENPERKNSPILVDYERFLKYRDKMCRMSGN